MKTGNTIRMTLALMLFIFSTGFANKKDATKDPKAKKILNEFVTATGGEKAIAGIETLSSKSQLEFVESGLVLKREILETNH